MMLKAQQKLDVVSHYKFEKICELSHPNTVAGFEILSKTQQLSWPAFDRQTLGLIGHLDQGLAGHVSINLSAASIINTQDSLIQRAAEARPGLVIEWVESFCSEKDFKLVAESLSRWKRDFGIMVSIDDIGKGQDGVERLLAVQADFAKIDGAILHAARTSPKHRGAMKFLCQWCKEENVPTVIEWVETGEDMRIAQDCGGIFGQGYYFEGIERC